MSLPLFHVGEWGFAPGALASTPSAVPTGTIKQARNNQGTNVQVPYRVCASRSSAPAAARRGEHGGHARCVAREEPS
eukprot:3555604-Prymnesium_polylepis.2